MERTRKVRVGEKMDKVISEFAKNNSISKTAASNVLAGLLKGSTEIIKVKEKKKRGIKEFQC